MEIAREIRVARHQAIALGRGVKVRFYPHHGYYRVYEPEARKCNLGSGISYEYVAFHLMFVNGYSVNLIHWAPLQPGAQWPCVMLKGSGCM